MDSPQVRISASAPKKVEYKKATSEPPQRLVMSIDGMPKSGKTEFALSLPGPLVVHDFNFGLEGVVEKHLPHKEIFQFKYAVPITARLPGSTNSSLVEPASRVWEEFVTNFRASLQDMRSVVVDTGSEIWELLRLARLGKLTQVPPMKYGEVNAEFRQLTQLALNQNHANVIYIHKVKPVYKNEQKTEETERAGFGDIEYDVQTVLRTNRDYSKSGADQFSLKIEECRANILATGKEFRAGDMAFSKVAHEIYPTISEDFWLK